MAKRKAGDLGAYKLTATEGASTVEHMSAPLPTNKEALEATFAEGFIKAYHEQNVFGGTALIEAFEQQGTGDLDYRINQVFPRRLPGACRGDPALRRMGA